jgi:hypothetical protein
MFKKTNYFDMWDTLPNTSWSFDFLCISKALQSILSFIGLQHTQQSNKATNS